MKFNSIRIIRKVTYPWKSGPGNGQYALQRSLRRLRLPWLKIGGQLKDTDIPWFWCWQDAPKAWECEQNGRPFIIGPDMLFSNWKSPSIVPVEKKVCRAKHCVLTFTQSNWYRDLIESERNSGKVDEEKKPIVLFPYPIEPMPGPPLGPKYDLLIYVKSGVSPQLVKQLAISYPRHRILRYGSYDRCELIFVARRSRVAVYLSDNDRGPLALAEILLAGCPSVGTERGAPWIRNSINGHVVHGLKPDLLLSAIKESFLIDRTLVRKDSECFFAETRITHIVLQALRKVLKSF